MPAATGASTSATCSASSRVGTSTRPSGRRGSPLRRRAGRASARRTRASCRSRSWPARRRRCPVEGDRDRLGLDGERGGEAGRARGRGRPPSGTPRSAKPVGMYSKSGSRSVVRLRRRCVLDRSLWVGDGAARARVGVSVLVMSSIRVPGCTRLRHAPAAIARCQGRTHDRGHEGRTHRQRLPPPRRAALPATASPSSTSRTSRPSRGARSPTPRWPSGPGRRRRPRRTRHRRGRTRRDRQPQLGPPADRLLRRVSGSGRMLVPINFRLVAEEVKYIVEHCGARVLLVDPELEGAMAVGRVRAQVRHRRRARRRAAEHASSRSRGTYDEDATATINYTSGTTARPKGVQLTHRNIWLNATTFGWQLGDQRPRRVPAHAAAVPLQRVGRALRRHRDGRHARHHPQDRRRRDPAPRRAARRHA